jgi:hypothetical protein
MGCGPARTPSRPTRPQMPTVAERPSRDLSRSTPLSRSRSSRDRSPVALIVTCRPALSPEETEARAARTSRTQSSFESPRMPASAAASWSRSVGAMWTSPAGRSSSAVPCPATRSFGRRRAAALGRFLSPIKPPPHLIASAAGTNSRAPMTTSLSTGSAGGWILQRCAAASSGRGTQPALSRSASMTYGTPTGRYWWLAASTWRA